jgi:hypothetical protein
MEVFLFQDESFLALNYLTFLYVCYLLVKENSLIFYY